MLKQKVLSQDMHHSLSPLSVTDQNLSLKTEQVSCDQMRH
jgi:hypothetical protein